MKTAPGAASLESFAALPSWRGQAASSSLQFTWWAAHSFSGRAWLEEASFSHEWNVVLAAPKLGIATPVSSSGPSRNSQGQPVALSGAAISTPPFDSDWAGVGLADYKEPKSEVLTLVLIFLEQFCLFHTYIVRKYCRGYNVICSQCSQYISILKYFLYTTLSLNSKILISCIL